jgi:hypothetical protein
MNKMIMSYNRSALLFETPKSAISTHTLNSFPLEIATTARANSKIS